MSGQLAGYEEQTAECFGCGRPYLRAALAGVEGLPGYRWPRYCPACIEALCAAYGRRCVLCGAAYWAATPAQPQAGEVTLLAAVNAEPCGSEPGGSEPGGSEASVSEATGLCPACDTPYHAHELARVRAHLARARALGLPATLTLPAWLATLAHFNGGCAYCGSPFTDLDHFIPVAAGGGASADNCVPACARCNSLKGAAAPTTAGAGALPAEVVARVAAYLRR